MTYHLSHTDLDGYSCQLLTNKVFKDIKFFNSGYGKQITQNFEKIEETITSDDLLLITDLNLTEEQADYIDEKSKETGFDILLLDHHGTGKPSAEKYDWYNLDTTKCATRLTYEYYSEKLTRDENILSSFVNAYDIYIEKHSYFVFGKTLNGILMSNRKMFPKVLHDEERKILFSLIEESAKTLYLTESIFDTENNVYTLLRHYLSFGVDKPKILPFDALKAQYLYNPIIEHNMFDTIEIDGYKVEVYFDLSDIFQEFSHLRLEKSDLDIALSIGGMGNISLRALNGNDVRVDQIARKYFNGGGHPKASGGRVDKGDIKKLDRTSALTLIKEATSKPN